MIDPRLIYGTTLAQGAVNPQALLQQTAQPGIAQIPTGTVETTHEPSKDYKVAGEETRGSMSAMDTAQQKRLDAVDQQAKREVELEGVRAKAAQDAAKAAEETEKKREDMRQAEEKRRGEEVAARAQGLTEFEKTAKVSSLFEDMTPARRFLSAIAVGAGQWASVMGGGPNNAYQIFKDQEENHRKVQEAAIKKATERVMNQTKSAEEARKYFDTAMEDLDKRQVTKLKVLDLQLAALEKANPSAAAKAAEARAQVQIDYEKGKRDFISGYDTNVKETGKSTQESSGNKNPTDPAIHETADQRTMALYAANMRREINKMKALPPVSEAGLKAFQDNETQMYAAAEEAKSLGGAAKVIALRRVDALTRSKFSGVKDDDAVSINAMESANEAFRRVLSGANIQEKEKADLLSQNQIQPLDSVRLRASKLQRMDEITEDFMTLSGNAGKRLADASTARAFAGQPAQPTGKVGSPNRAKQSPAPQRDSAGDYAFVLSKESELDPQRRAAFEDAIKRMQSNDPKERAKAERGFKILRDELPKD